MLRIFRAEAFPFDCLCWTPLVLREMERPFRNLLEYTVRAVEFLRLMVVEGSALKNVRQEEAVRAA